MCMNQQVSQIVHTMTSMLVLGMTFGMAGPVMLQRKNEHPLEFADFAAWFKYGSTTRVYSLLSNDEVPAVTKRLRLSGRHNEAEATEYVHNNTGVTVIEFYDHFEDVGVPGQEQASMIGMMMEHGSITLKEGRR